MSNDKPDSVFKEAIKRLWGAPAIISVVVLFVLSFLSSVGKISQTMSIILIGLVLIGMFLSFFLEVKRINTERLEKKSKAPETEKEPEKSKILAERIIAYEIQGAIKANLEGDKLSRDSAVYWEISDRFQKGAGLQHDTMYKSFIIGVGQQMGNIQEQESQSKKKAKILMGTISSDQ